MSLKEDIEYLNNYFVKFIDTYIIKDIKKLIKINDKHKTSYPYLALSFSGIDFFGQRFRWFIKKWMKETNPLYEKDNLAKLIYNSCRNGIFHNGVLKNTFNISSYLYPTSKHLHLITNSNLIFLHSIQFAYDFINAQKNYRENLNKSNDESYLKRLCNNLSIMIKENNEENKDESEQFIEELKENKKIFCETEYSIENNTTETQTNTVTKTKDDIETSMTVNPLNQQ